MTLLHTTGLLIGSAAVSGVAILLALRSGMAARWLDVPVERSLHATPIPRFGGLAICLAIATICAIEGVLWTHPFLWLALAAVFCISVLDDRRALPAGVRLLIHLLAAWLWSASLFGADWRLIPIALATAWMANLFNFMDGADGLAGVMAAIGFAILGWLALAQGHILAVPALVACGASAGFLVFNFPPARLFMGDAGSIPLGFLAAAVAFWGVRDGTWSLWVPIVTFAPFIVDASCTLAFRVLRGRKPWQAHREHLYQLLVLQGWTHRRLLAAAAPLMLTCAALAAWLQKMPAPSQPVWGAAICLLLATLWCVLRILIARHHRTT